MKRAIVALTMIAVAGSASAQIITLDHFVSPAFSQTVSEFSCADAGGNEIDGSATYALRRGPAGVFEGSLDSLTLKSKAVDAADLGRINKLVDGASIEGITPSCDGAGSIRLDMKVWRRHANGGDGATVWVTIIRDKEGKLDVR